MLRSLRLVVGLMALAAGLAIGGVASAYTEQEGRWCIGKDTPTPDQTIKGCTAVIQTKQIKNHAIAYVMRGNAYINKKDYARAIADYDQAIRLDAKLASAYNGRGLVHYNRKDYARAIADYDQAIRLDPKYAFAYNNRGNAYGDEKSYARAIADFDRAIRLNPKYANAYNGRGIVYSNKKDYARAIADYDQVIRLDPKFALVYNNRGTLYANKKDYDRAIADYGQAIRLDPKYVHAYNNRAIAYSAKGDIAHAIADYGEVIRLIPKNSATYNSRGLAYLYTGALSKALADLSQASDLEPKNAYYAIWLDIIAQRNNVPSRLAQQVPKLDMTAWPGPVVRLFLGQFTPAATLAAADNADPKTKNDQICEANFYSGELALRKGAKNEAGRLFKLAVSGCPTSFIEWDAANEELKALGMKP